MKLSTLASYSMTLPSADASRMRDPLGEAASTVLRLTALVNTPSELRRVATRDVRSTLATKGSPPPPSRITARMALEETAMDCTYPDSVSISGVGCRVSRSNTLMMCALSQPTNKERESNVTAIDIGLVHVRS